MSKQIIHTTKGDMLVREDAAKSFRGVHWGLISLGIIILIVAAMFVGGLLTAR